jgi:hypothetical protein
MLRSPPHATNQGGVLFASCLALALWLCSFRPNLRGGRRRQSISLMRACRLCTRPRLSLALSLATYVCTVRMHVCTVRMHPPSRNASRRGRSLATHAFARTRPSLPGCGVQRPRRPRALPRANERTRSERSALQRASARSAAVYGPSGAEKTPRLFAVLRTCPGTRRGNSATCHLAAGRPAARRRRIRSMSARERKHREKRFHITCCCRGGQDASPH